jgi:hypothetical protein
MELLVFGMIISSEIVPRTHPENNTRRKLPSIDEKKKGKQNVP